MLLESDILRFFFTGPHLVSSPLCSGVWCWLPLRSSTPTSAVRLSLVQSRLPSVVSCRNSPLSCPTPNCLCSCPTTNSSLGLLPPTSPWSPVQLPTLSTGSRRQLSFASPYHFRVRRDFMSKNPLSGFAPKQTIESSALAAYPHSATVQTDSWYLSNYPMISMTNAFVKMNNYVKILVIIPTVLMKMLDADEGV